MKSHRVIRKWANSVDGGKYEYALNRNPETIKPVSPQKRAIQQKEYINKKKEEQKLMRQAAKAIKIEKEKKAVQEKPEERNHELSDAVQCPYGYEVKNGKPVIVAEEAEVVRRIINLYNDGEGMSSKQITEMLIQEGVTTRTGGKLQVNFVLKIWRNKELYMGRKRNLFGYYPPIL